VLAAVERIAVEAVKQSKHEIERNARLIARKGF
jgi:hypothetical protein